MIYIPVMLWTISDAARFRLIRKKYNKFNTFDEKSGVLRC